MNCPFCGHDEWHTASSNLHPSCKRCGTITTDYRLIDPWFGDRARGPGGVEFRVDSTAFYPAKDGTSKAYWIGGQRDDGTRVMFRERDVIVVMADQSSVPVIWRSPRAEPYDPQTP